MKLLEKIVIGVLSLILLVTTIFFIYAFNIRNPTKLDLCGLGITYPYYVSKDYYKKDFNHFKEHIIENYDPSISKHNSFIVRIQFMINCKGEIGNYKVRSYDYNYQPIQISKEITTHFLKLIDEYNLWNTPLNRYNEEVNIFKFYAFKVHNGIIIEILPK